MNHKEGHWQPTQVIILTATKDIAMACNRAKCQKWQIVLCKMAFIVIPPHLKWLKKSTKTDTYYSSYNKYPVLKKEDFPQTLYLRLHVPFAPLRDPLPFAGFPWLVHLCPEDGECLWGSMGWAVPGTSGTGLRWARGAEGEQMTISLVKDTILKIHFKSD